MLKALVLSDGPKHLVGGIERDLEQSLLGLGLTELFQDFQDGDHRVQRSKELMSHLVISHSSHLLGSFVLL